MAGDVIDKREIAPLDLFVMVMDTAESPRTFVAVTVTCDMTIPPLAVVAADAANGTPAASTSAPQPANDHNAVSDFLTSGYYQS